jgi:hypothetical protein
MPPRLALSVVTGKNINTIVPNQSGTEPVVL